MEYDYSADTLRTNTGKASELQTGHIALPPNLFVSLSAYLCIYPRMPVGTRFYSILVCPPLIPNTSAQGELLPVGFIPLTSCMWLPIQ